MTINTFIRKIKSLHRADTGIDLYIVKRLENQKGKLLSYIDELNSEDFHALGNTHFNIARNINYIYQVAISCIDLYFHGRFDESREIIYNAFFNKNNPRHVLLKYTKVRSGTQFFRIRSNETYDLYSPIEMFHIPFEKRSLTTNQRYSISGYPCLYLGTSVYGCWEELNRPNIDMSNVVAMNNIESLTIMDLSLSGISTNLFTEEDLYNITLSLICSLRVNDKNSPFKPEYIIPQAILGCMIRRNDKSDPYYCDGIKYTSSFYDTKRCLFDDITLFDNYVIPIKQSMEKGYCKELMSLFTISSTTSIAINKILNPYSDHLQNSSTYDDYEISEFGIIEHWLRNDKKTPVSQLYKE